MVKVINPIMKKTYGGRGYRVFIKITFEEGRLSISGVEGPLPSGNCLGGCGQIDMHLRTESRKEWRYLKGWNAAKMKKLLDIWDEWHLNDMKAGTPKQEAFVKQLRDSENRYYDYAELCEALQEANLLIDDGYKYGSKWLRVDVPQDVIDWLSSLPDTEFRPAWV